MKKVLYVLNDCMRSFSYERAAGLSRALQALEEAASLYILRSDAYADFAPEHNIGEYNIYRLPDYRDFDCILLDINSIFNRGTGGYSARGIEHVVRAAAASGRPVLSLANRIEGFRYVGIDNYAAMTSVIEHLHREQGLTDFWFALGPADNFENRARTEALRDYCVANDLPCGEERFYSESFIIECGIHAFHTLLERHKGNLPQAVICANDYIAFGICHAAEELGYRVPRDLLVTGFDNTSVSATFSPSLTTVEQGRWETGAVCVEAIRRIWQGEEIPEVITIPTRLILRESSSAPSLPADAPSRDTGEYIGGASSITNFNYKLSSMQYRLPGCKSLEEICQAFVECVSVLNCDGVDLILDRRLFDPEGAIGFQEQIGQLHDTADDMPTEGYADTLELVFSWRADGEASYIHRPVGNDLDALHLVGEGENALFAPLHFMAHTVGCLCLHNSLDIMRIRAVSTVVSTLTLALRNYFTRRDLGYINHVLSGISMKDGLTGLYNRLGYHEFAYPLFREADRNGKRLAILFMDLDRLKQLNDSYGHAVGDLAIKCVANAILAKLPDRAVPIRYGGDEFLVLVPGLDQNGAEALLAAMAQALPAEAAALGIPAEIAFSSGYVLTEPGTGRPLDEYVQEADAIMYQCKKARKAQRI